MKRITLTLLCLLLLVSSVTPTLAAPPAQGGSVSNSFGDPNDMYLEFSISGAGFTLREGTPSSYEGPWGGGSITFSGKMIVARAEGTMSYVTMSANLADQSVAWPPPGEESRVEGKTVSLPFSFTFDVPPDYTGSTVTGSARVEACGGVCGNYSVDFRVDLPTPTPTAEPPTPTTIPALSPTPEPGYRLLISTNSPTDPLRFTLRLEKQASSGAEGAYRPVAGARLRVFAPAYGGNQNRLADEFVAPACQNCEWREAGGDRLAHLAASDGPIVVQTDGAGEAQLAFFLDFARLSGQVPERDTPLAIPIAAEYWEDDGQGGESMKVRAEHSADLDAIGVVTAITYQQAQMFDVAERALPRTSGPLESYYDDPGTRDGPRTLAQGDRVLIDWPGRAGISAAGATPGTRLAAGDPLHVGDRVTINACDMVTNRIVDGLPAGAPGAVWVKVRFFDGTRAKVGVNGGVCRTTVTFGESPQASGWLSSRQKFFYWSANGTMNAIIGSYLWPYKVITGMSSAGKFLAWATGNEAAGWSPVYIQLKSALVVEFDEAGVMHVTTREGEPVIYTQATGEEGVPVQEGRTARIEGGLTVGVQDTHGETALQADGLLAGLDDSTAETTGDAPAQTGKAAIPLIGDLETGTLALLGMVCCGAALIGGGMLAVLAIGLRRRRGRSKLVPPQASVAAPPQPVALPVTPRPPAPPVADAYATMVTGDSGGGREDWCLSVVEGPDAGKRFSLGELTRLGRNPDNDVPLNDRQASRYHAQVRRLMGDYTLADLGSSNGTFLNGARIDQPTHLQDGDTIRIGQTSLQVIVSATAWR